MEELRLVQRGRLDLKRQRGRAHWMDQEEDEDNSSEDERRTKRHKKTDKKSKRDKRRKGKKEKKGKKDKKSKKGRKVGLGALVRKLPKFLGVTLSGVVDLDPEEVLNEIHRRVGVAV